MTDVLDPVRRQLQKASTVFEVKIAHDKLVKLAAAAAAEKDFARCDEITVLRLEASRRGGAMLLAGAERPPGIDAETWCRRAAVSDEKFAGILARALTASRRRAGDVRPPSDLAARKSDETQSKTLVSAWRADEFGNPTRYVCGVDLRRYRQSLASGRDAKKVEEEMLAEAVATPALAGAARRRRAA